MSTSKTFSSPPPASQALAAAIPGLRVVPTLDSVLAQVAESPFYCDGFRDHVNWLYGTCRPLKPFGHEACDLTDPDGKTSAGILIKVDNYDRPCMLLSCWRDAATPVTLQKAPPELFKAPKDQEGTVMPLLGVLPPDRQDRFAFEMWLRSLDN